jgi:hypothetical protein
MNETNNKTKGIPMDETNEFFRKDFDDAVGTLVKRGAMEELLEAYSIAIDEAIREKAGEPIVESANQTIDNNQ